MPKFFKIDLFQNHEAFITEIEGEKILNEDTGYVNHHNGNWESELRSYVKSGMWTFDLRDCFENLEEAKLELIRRLFDKKSKLELELKKIDKSIDEIVRKDV